MHAYRFALRPGWVALHVSSVALIITMVLLGRWQLLVSESKHFDIQNFGYAFQWWLFSLFVGVMWWRVMRDHARRAQPAAAASARIQTAGATDAAETTAAIADREPATYRRYVMPNAPNAPAQRADADPVYAAYNDYLARLNAEDA